ncbi:hypothetical protein QWY82_06745 [Simiduia curdlanivorans]|uniref:Uncharacterized protein n=1 Tax=Simiduia curdlanivorans TaxID=1492769 RepID=A0ABV8V922_9GAMM|nr:hypothetical protein [Simiduia curdlanivorans]MDN3638502.1 hypothetical protein [Simiduia curdlanivorans]
MKTILACAYPLILSILSPVALAELDIGLVDPEWEFSDDFESPTPDASFWQGEGVYLRYSIPDPTSSGNKVMEMKYVPNSEGSGDSWSEYDFRLGVNAVQLHMSFDIYIPEDYIHIEHNHKLFYLWSGVYGTSNANISINSEMWGMPGGASPSIYIGVDGNNYGHSMISGEPLIMKDREGSWSRIDVLLQLAEDSHTKGSVEIYKDGVFITGTHHPQLQKAYTQAPLGKNLIPFSTRGNFIDQGTLLGWANGADGGGFLVDTVFLIDNFKIQANSKIGATKGSRRAKVP